MVCHSRASNYVLGICTVQLNHDLDYEAVLGTGHAADNQLRTLEHLGLLEVNWWGDGTGALFGRAVAAGIGREREEAGLEGREETPEQKREREKKINDARWSWVGRKTASRDPEVWSFSKRK